MAKINWDKGMNDWIDNKWNPAPDIHIDGLENDERAQTPSVQQYKPVNNDTPTYNNKTSYNAPVNQQAQQPQSNIFKNLFNAIFHANENPDGMFEDNAQKSSSFLGSVGQGLLKGAGEFDKSIFDLLNLADKPRQMLQNKLGIQGPDTVKNYLDNTRGQFDNTINDSNHYIAGASLPDKAAFNISSLIPQTIGALTTFKAPIPKMGNLGEGLSAGIGTPVENALSFLGNSKAAGIGKEAIKQGSEMAAYNIGTTAANNIGNNENNNLANAGLQGFAGGALFGAGGKLLGDILAKRGGSLIPNQGISPTLKPNEIPSETPNIMPNEPQITPPLESNIKPPTDNVRPSLEGKPNMMDLQQFNITKANSDLTTADNPLAKRGQFVDNSIQNSEVTPKEVKDYYKNNPDYYIPKSNNESWNKAQDSVNNNFKAEHDKLIRRQSMETADDTAKAIAVYKKYIEDGNMQGAIEWAGQIKGKIRNTAQALQFMSTLKRFTPEWTLNKAQTEIEKSWTPKQKEILDNAPTGTKEEIAKKFKIPYISDDAAKTITDMSTKIGEMQDGRTKREAIANLNDFIHSQIPASWRDKVNSMQTLSMLSGTKTPIRNIIGNTLYKTVDNIKEIPRTMIDIPLSKITGERTATLPDIGAQLKGYKSGLKESALDFKNNINTRNINDKFELNRTSPWDKNGNLFNKAMSQAERVNRFALDDRPAMQASYDGEMARQKKLAKINNVPFNEADAKEKADLKSLSDTFNNESSIADLAINLKRNANILSNQLLSGNITKKLDQATKDEYAKWGAGDLLVKFARVPANIIGKQIEYSPVNVVGPFVKALKDAIKGNGFDQDAFANNLAKGLTGTGIMALGAMLHNTMTTDADKNINKSNLDTSTGAGQFKFNISAVRRLVSGEKPDFQKGDLITSYDWANPISVLLATGASMAKARDGKTIKGVGQVAGDLISSMNEGVNSIINQPMNQGLKTWVQQGDLGKGVSQSLAALPQTFIPSIVNQFRQLSDNTARETYDPNIFKQGLNQMVNRIPGLEKTLPQKVDIMGENKDTFQGDSNNLFNVLFNPAITTRYQPTQAQENALNLFKLTGNSAVLPQLASKTIDVDGKKIQLTPEQFGQYQTLLGKGASDILSNIDVGTDGLNKLAKDTAKLIGDNSQEAKIKVLKDNNLPLPLSVTKDNISSELTNNRSKDAKAIRDRVKEISDSDMSVAEKQQALDSLLNSASSVPKPKKKTSTKANIFK